MEAVEAAYPCSPGASGGSCPGRVCLVKRLRTPGRRRRSHHRPQPEVSLRIRGSDRPRDLSDRRRAGSPRFAAPPNVQRRFAGSAQMPIEDPARARRAPGSCAVRPGRTFLGCSRGDAFMVPSGRGRSPSPRSEWHESGEPGPPRATPPLKVPLGSDEGFNPLGSRPRIATGGTPCVLSDRAERTPTALTAKLGRAGAAQPMHGPGRP
jgi:hypothetical protein